MLFVLNIYPRHSMYGNMYAIHGVKFLGYVWCLIYLYVTL